MRVGFFGGTFDPPHIGHLAVARAAVQRLQLDRVLLVPTGRQPLKEGAPRASYANRLAMVMLLCDGERALEASALEAPSPEGSPNYTIDTLQDLRASLGWSDHVFIIVGADSFLDLRRWREPDRLLAEAEWIIVSRPGFSLESLDALHLTAEQRARVHLLTDVEVPVSATELREKLRDGENCREWIPAPVLSYIAEHELYR